MQVASILVENCLIRVRDVKYCQDSCVGSKNAGIKMSGPTDKPHIFVCNNYWRECFVYFRDSLGSNQMVSAFLCTIFKICLEV